MKVVILLKKLDSQSLMIVGISHLLFRPFVKGKLDCSPRTLSSCIAMLCKNHHIVEIHSDSRVDPERPTPAQAEKLYSGLPIGGSFSIQPFQSNSCMGSYLITELMGLAVLE